MATKPIAKTTTSTESVEQITYRAAALKAPRITEAAARLADQARDAGWTHEDYLAAVLEREVSARTQRLGRPLRIHAPGREDPRGWRAPPPVRTRSAPSG